MKVKRKCKTFRNQNFFALVTFFTFLSFANLALFLGQQKDRKGRQVGSRVRMLL
jgi:hypothetical protein